jgi:hypothetical protein
MKYIKIFLVVFHIAILQPALFAATNSVTSYSADGIYSVCINSSTSTTNGPVVNVASGKLFRMIFAAEQNIITSLPASCGIIINNSYCTNVYIPAIWGQYYDYDYQNINFQDLTLAGPCKITFTNSTGYSLLHTFQISSVPSSSQTDY